MSKQENPDKEKKLPTGKSAETHEETPLERLSRQKKQSETGTHAKARADIEKLMKKEDLDRLHEIDLQKAKKKKEMEDTKAEAQEKARSPSSLESWVGQREENGITSGFIKSGIESKVEEKFDQYMGKIREYGITDKANITVAMAAAKQIIFEHYQKTGNDINDVTLPWVKNELGAKLRQSLSMLQEILKKPDYKNVTPIKLLEDFSTWSGLCFIRNGILETEPLKNFLRIKKEILFGMVHSFSKTLDLKLEMTALEGESTNLLGKKIDAATMFREQRITLTKTCRLVLKENGTMDEEKSSKTITDILPANLDPAIRQGAMEYLLAEAKKITLAPGQTLELNAKGEWKKIDLEEEKKEHEKAKKEAEITSKKDEEEKDEPINTGNPSLDRFLNSIKDFFKKIAAALGPIYAKVTSFGKNPEETKEEEFASLTEEEKKEASALKETLKKAGLNMETVKPLLKKDEVIKKILKKRRDEHVTWKKFLEQNISDEERQTLKSTSKLSAEEIAGMLMS